MRRKKSNESLSALLDIIGTNAAKAAKAALKEGADGVVEDAKSRCPVKTGALRDSIHAEVKRNGTYIKVVADAQNDGVYYGKVVEFSTKINKPFLYPAIDAGRDSIRDNIARAVKEGLKKR
nr:MAG TPA: type I neck protein [Caudoviricetes sp.]